MVDAITLDSWQYVVLAYCFGFPTALAYGKYIIHATEGNPGKAALYDGTIMLMSAVVYQVWALTGDNIFVLLGNVAGNVTGTYLVIRKHKQTKELTKPL